jgi:hypothetical protein
LLIVGCALLLLASDEVGNTIIEVHALFSTVAGLYRHVTLYSTVAGLYRHVTLYFVYCIYFRGSLSRYIVSTGPGRSGDRVPGAMRFSASIQTDLGGPRSVRHNVYLLSLSGLKRSGRQVDHRPPSGAILEAALSCSVNPLVLLVFLVHFLTICKVGRCWYCP